NLTRPATGNWVTPLVMHPSNQDTIWGGYNGVYRSDDGGKSWNKVTPGINNNLNVLAVASSNTKYIYASRGNLLYRSANGGANFKTITAPATVTSIFVSKYNPMKIWITCDNSTNRVLTSNDGGDTFINLSQGLPTFAARSVVVDEDAHQTIYVGMNIGVYYRDTLTNKWAEHAVGLPLVSVNEVEIQKSGAKLRVATYGRGVWESDLRNVILPCAPPDVNYMMVDGVNHFSARVSWNPADDAIHYTTQYKLIADTGWTTKSVATPNTRDTFTGLKSNSSYKWRVKSNCNMSTGAFSEGSFNTLVNGTSTVNYHKENLRIYPQPAGNTINVAFQLQHSGVARITMYDMAGNAVLGTRINAVSGENTLPLDVTVLPAGRYLLKVQTDSMHHNGTCVLVK
ncbi:MAG: T9SS type A sorting domain-containing protein, partial [Sphingomonadales bacterium]